MKLFLGLIIILLFISLACNTRTIDEDGQEPEIPTSAVDDAPPDPIKYPLIFTASGAKTSFETSVNGSCPTEATLTLVVREDSTAELSATGPNFVDHINCTPAGFDETWVINGLADILAKSVAFGNCNNMAFTAEGIITYSNEGLRGEVSCYSDTKEKKVTFRVGK